MPPRVIHTVARPPTKNGDGYLNNLNVVSSPPPASPSPSQQFDTLPQQTPASQLGPPSYNGPTSLPYYSGPSLYQTSSSPGGDPSYQPNGTGQYGLAGPYSSPVTSPTVVALSSYAEAQSPPAFQMPVPSEPQLPSPPVVQATPVMQPQPPPSFQRIQSIRSPPPYSQAQFPPAHSPPAILAHFPAPRGPRSPPAPQSPPFRHPSAPAPFQQPALGRSSSPYAQPQSPPVVHSPFIAQPSPPLAASRRPPPIHSPPPPHTHLQAAPALQPPPAVHPPSRTPTVPETPPTYQRTSVYQPPPVSHSPPVIQSSPPPQLHSPSPSISDSLSARSDFISHGPPTATTYARPPAVHASTDPGQLGAQFCWEPIVDDQGRPTDHLSEFANSLFTTLQASSSVYGGSGFIEPAKYGWFCDKLGWVTVATRPEHTKALWDFLEVPYGRIFDARGAEVVRLDREGFKVFCLRQVIMAPQECWEQWNHAITKFGLRRITSVARLPEIPRVCFPDQRDVARWKRFETWSSNLSQQSQGVDDAPNLGQHYLHSMPASPPQPMNAPLQHNASYDPSSSGKSSKLQPAFNSPTANGFQSPQPPAHHRTYSAGSPMSPNPTNPYQQQGRPFSQYPVQLPPTGTTEHAAPSASPSAPPNARHASMEAFTKAAKLGMKKTGSLIKEVDKAWTDIRPRGSMTLTELALYGAVHGLATAARSSDQKVESQTPHPSHASPTQTYSNLSHPTASPGPSMSNQRPPAASQGSSTSYHHPSATAQMHGSSAFQSHPSNAHAASATTAYNSSSNQHRPPSNLSNQQRPPSGPSLGGSNQHHARPPASQAGWSPFFMHPSGGHRPNWQAQQQNNQQTAWQSQQQNNQQQNWQAQQQSSQPESWQNQQSPQFSYDLSAWPSQQQPLDQETQQNVWQTQQQNDQQQSWQAQQQLSQPDSWQNQQSPQSNVDLSTWPAQQQTQSPIDNSSSWQNQQQFGQQTVDFAVDPNQFVQTDGWAGNSPGNSFTPPGDESVYLETAQDSNSTMAYGDICTPDETTTFADVQDQDGDDMFVQDTQYSDGSGSIEVDETDADGSFDDTDLTWDC